VAFSRKIEDKFRRMWKVQVVVHVDSAAESYIQEKLFEHLKAPECCPNCKSQRRLQALGYYERSVASMESVRCIRLQIRRFRCFDCQRTTSLLPSFCQPYRLLPNEMIASHFKGFEANASRPWEFLLKRYWHRYTVWLDEIRRRLTEDFGLETSLQPADEVWGVIDRTFNGVAHVTMELVLKSRITLFGSYRCHRPFGYSVCSEQVHTTVMFPSGKDPPDSDITDENE
jgi:hypothetical protein